ncbi:aspartyl-phosphate phosphatase Spo0E family protein [Clostridium tyrobutyricum]|uniref:aspartyl-phosphate phosphatase Spo0E family protein n=1 Tax=Clostridium tyrobutyricum TaxID=1519 RepID=UPI001A9AF9CB|nr:aspartyl-phosphate phosphatase Spo0E family protein [Clostridium tyrobutyricum]
MRGGRKIEKLRKKLNEYVELYGPLDNRTLEISQKLDKLIVEQMKGDSNDISGK